MGIENSNIVDATTARILCIERAVRHGMEIKEDWPDWLINGVKVIEAGGVISAEWLEEQDKENSYI